MLNLPSVCTYLVHIHRMRNWTSRKNAVMFTCSVVLIKHLRMLRLCSQKTSICSHDWPVLSECMSALNDQNLRLHAYRENVQLYRVHTMHIVSCYLPVCNCFPVCCIRHSLLKYLQCYCLLVIVKSIWNLPFPHGKQLTISWERICAFNY